MLQQEGHEKDMHRASWGGRQRSKKLYKAVSDRNQKGIVKDSKNWLQVSGKDRGQAGRWTCWPSEETMQVRAIKKAHCFDHLYFPPL